MSWKLLQGDVMAKLAEIETGTVQCCVTSPPYWGLRDYGVPGQLGLEPTPEEYVEKMVQVFREVKRVLRDDGTVFLNLGDCYFGSSMTGGTNSMEGSAKRKGRMFEKPSNCTINQGKIQLKTKDLVGIPWRVAFALQADGWYLRSAMPWLKGSAMPESVTDRPTSAVEYFFLLTKNRKYFYDVEAVKVLSTASEASRKRAEYGRYDARDGRAKRNFRTGKPDYLQKPGNDYGGATRNRRNTDWFMDSIRDILEGKSGTLLHDENNIPTAIFCNPQPYKEAHFATFSPRLITPMILAGSSPRACEVCGSPWERVVEKQLIPQYESRHGGYNARGGPKGMVNMSKTWKPGVNLTTTTGWRPTRSCENEGRGRCTVLDPFAGSGTTLWVAEHYGRDSIGIELSPKYCELINKRMSNRQMTLFERGADL